MKKNIRTIIGVAAVSVSLVMSLGAGWSLAAAPEPESEVEGYMLREYCGKVAVYLPGGVSPVETTEIKLNNLPRADREGLKLGIYIENSTKLAEILEDLGS